MMANQPNNFDISNQPTSPGISNSTPIVPLPSHPTVVDPLDWKYEMRRDMQEILPNIYLGPYSASKNLQLLQSTGITHLVLIRSAAERLIKKAFPDKFIYNELVVTDIITQNVISLFPQSKKFIDEAVQNGGKVLVFCMDGISRSPTFMIAYVMEHCGWDFQTSFVYVQNKRFCMNPNDGFKVQLKEYEPIFLARHQFQQQQLQQNPDDVQRLLHRKRSAEYDTGEESSHHRGRFDNDSNSMDTMR